MKKYNVSNLSDYYQQVLKDAKAFVHAPIKGTIYIAPYAMQIWKEIQNYLQKEFQKLHVQEVYFPSLIPFSMLKKEMEHVKGFKPELFFVNEVGNKKLKEPLVVRPTSEILFADFFNKFIQNYSQIPIYLVQWCNVLREEKNTNPFLRNSEFIWQEGHTLHGNNDDAKQFILKIHKIYKKLLNERLAIATLSGEKSLLERFSGALNTLTHEVIMADGQALQTATSHELGQNFTKVFNIKYQNQNNSYVIPFSTSWGISSRILGGLFLSHGDEYGLILPPAIAPIQIKIIPKDNQNQNYALKIYQILKERYSKIQIDHQKFKVATNLAQIQGVPLQIHVTGPFEIEIYHRYKNQKIKCSKNDLLEKVNHLLKTTQHAMYATSKINLQKKIIFAKTSQKIKSIIKNKQIIKAPFCCSKECETKLKLNYQVSVRCIDPIKNNEVLKCIMGCHTKTSKVVYITRSY